MCQCGGACIGGCGDNGCTCPDIIVEGCGNIDKENAEQWIISIPCVEVISENGSINVQKTVDGNSTIFNIEKVNEPDRKVGACVGDTTPGYLFNEKLRVDTTGPLTYTIHSCPGNSWVEIGFDETKLTYPDTLECDCPESSEPDCTVTCGNCNIQPKGMSRLANNITISQLTNTERNYYVAGAAVAELDSAGWTRINAVWDNVWSYGGITNSNGIMTVCRDGIYEFSFEGSQEQNKGVHATRVGLVLITPGGTLKTLTQSRYSGTDAFFWSGSQPANPDPSYANYGDNRHTTVAGGTSTPSGGTFSMGTIFERVPLHGNRWRPAITSGSKIVMFIKVSTVVTGDAHSSNVNGQVSIIGASNVSAGGDDEFTFSVRNIDTPCECNA